MERSRTAGGRFAPEAHTADVKRALERFRKFCQFEPETGCVVWIGGRTQGRGHNVPYGSFWYAGRRWFAHRWAARFIHGLNIQDYQVDHCCDTIPKPNTLCVQHLQALTAKAHADLTETRKKFIHLQVGLISYDEAYGPPADDDDHRIPFYEPPKWLGVKGGYRGNDCPF